MPPEGIPPLDSNELLTDEEIVTFVRQAASLGINRVRLTGGEPLLRKGLIDLVQSIYTIPGIDEVSLTTNAILLTKYAEALAGVGLSRVNISLDTLDPEKFTRITRGGQIKKVYQGIASAEACGLTPIKINTVVVRGLNDDELPALAQLTTDHPWHIRFIELMPVGNNQSWGNSFPSVYQRFISVQEMKAQLSSLDLQPSKTPTGNGPARTFRIPNAPGTVGFISPVSEHFCENCNRLRLTADGALRPCLLKDIEIQVRDVLGDKTALSNLIVQAVALKPESHELTQQRYPETRRMVQIGG
jgi:cyclic pyranopterin phosphate synthase